MPGYKLPSLCIQFSRGPAKIVIQNKPDKIKSNQKNDHSNKQKKHLSLQGINKIALVR